SFSRSWPLKLDPEALHGIAVHGLHARFALMHIEALIRHTTLLKSHNKAETARSAPKKTGAAVVKSRSYFLWRA
ncbi:hypothetical protein PROCOU_10858, partial [Listeria rocourtiae FSL F6-920]